MNRVAAGALVGAALAAGLLLALAWLRARRAPRISARIGPFVGGAPALTRDWTLGGIVRSASGPGVGADLRLARAGWRGTRSHYRLEQVAWAASGACLAASAVVVLAPSAASAWVAMAVAGGVAGWLARDRALARQARRRRERIDAHLPAVAELLAFAVAAGESPYAALTRASGSTSGDLADEIDAAVSHVRSGQPLDTALRGLSDRAGTPAVERFVDGLLLALDRGTPLTDVLRAQAADARADQRRALLESAGRKDVLMLVPVVFLVLPTVVAVAIFPGLQGLRLVAP